MRQTDRMLLALHDTHGTNLVDLLILILVVLAIIWLAKRIF